MPTKSFVVIGDPVGAVHEVFGAKLCVCNLAVGVSSLHSRMKRISADSPPVFSLVFSEVFASSVVFEEFGSRNRG